ncbi:MAG: hypothetical protein QGG55_06980 [Verrucomicrobiota bacterium]|jgi:putative effector of murein hydrolase LrgA (UPF0299 family)|nr:hypothetical protein [Verrucomicrobiota bacterium]|tara:strand:- start:309 stop:575 length:267 start_codon:yes stop_codon:yes gene_type:complete
MSEPEKSIDPATRASTGAGQVLVIIGLILVYGVGGYWFIGEIIRDSEAKLWIKIGVPAIVIGITILFFTVLIQRMKAAKTDKYIDVKD